MRTLLAAAVFIAVEWYAAHDVHDVRVALAVLAVPALLAAWTVTRRRPRLPRDLAPFLIDQHRHRR